MWFILWLSHIEKLGSANKLLTTKECEVSEDGQSILSKLIVQSKITSLTFMIIVQLTFVHKWKY